MPFVTYLAVGISVLVFVGHMLEPDPWSSESLERWGVLDAWRVYDGGYYALLTSVFVHADLIHIAFNLYWLWILGRVVEDRFGASRYLPFLVTAAWFSSACQLAVGGETGVGLSGVGYALFGFMWMARPVVPPFRRVVDHRVVSLFLVWLVFCVVATRIGVMSIANTAHFSGLIFGTLAGAGLRVRWRRAAWSASVVLFAGATATVFWAPWSADWASVQAWRAQEGGDWATVETYASRAIELDPDSAYEYGLRGWARSQLGDDAGALADYERAITLDREDLESLNAAAWLRATAPDTDLRDPGRALDFARRAVALAPTDSNCLNTLGVALYRAGRWNEARETLERAMAAEDGGSVRDWLFAAMAEFRLGRKSEARRWRDRAVAWMERNPVDDEVGRFRAEADALLASG